MTRRWSEKHTRGKHTHTTTQQERCEKPNNIRQGPKGKPKKWVSTTNKTRKRTFDAINPKSPEQEGEKERVKEVARETERNEKRASRPGRQEAAGRV